MADYQPLIARAVAGLEKNTGDARRALYERARTALVAQLRGVSPALSESDVTRERLALEEAIRKVEAEAARQTRIEPARAERKLRPPEMPRWDPPAPTQSEPPPRPETSLRRQADAPPARQAHAAAAAAVQHAPAPVQSEMFGDQGQADPMPDQPPPNPQPARRPALHGRPQADRRSLVDSGLKDLREVMSEANELGEASARAVRSARDNFAAASDPHDHDREARMPQAEERDLPLDDRPPPMLEPSFALDDSRPVPQRAQSEDRPHLAGDPPASIRSYGHVVRIAVPIVAIACLAGLVAWAWPSVVDFYRFIRTPAVEVAKDQSAPATASRPAKVPDRFEPGSKTGQAQPSALGPGAGAAVAQRVVLYEEDPGDPQGKRFVGSAIWRTETVSPGSGQSPELAIRADIEIPERNLAVTWSLRRNTDQSLPASHTVEIMFRLPTDFPAGGIQNVPGILMKQAEQTRGVPLAGLAVKVTNGFFLVGLSSVDGERERNIQLLKERAWFDIPVVYNNNRRAILALEKGTPGERVFADAFQAWGQ